MIPTVSLDYFRHIMTSREMSLFWYMLSIGALLVMVSIIRRVFPTVAMPALLPLQKINIPQMPVWVIVSIGLALRLPRLGNIFWYDETFSAAVARAPLESLPAAILADVHPPLNYLIQWITVRILGLSEISMRIPALVCGLLLIVLMYALLRAMGASRATARAAALLVAVFPAAIYYSNEARQYSLLACLALGACIAILRNKPRWFGLAGAALPLTHNIGYVYLGVLYLALAIYRRDPFIRDRRWRSALLVAALPGAAWLPAMLLQSQDVSNGFWLWAPSIGAIFGTMLNMTLTMRLPTDGLALVYGVFVALLWASLWSGRRLFNWRWIVWVLLVAGVPAALALVSWLWHPVFLQRALLAPALALAVPIAALVTSNRAAAVACTGVILWSLVGYFSPELDRVDLRRLFAPCADADQILYLSPSTAIQGAMYAPKIDQYLWSSADDLSQQLSADGRAALGFSAAEISDLSGRVCIPAFFNPMMSGAERDTIGALIAAYPYNAQSMMINEFYSYVVYLIDLPR